MTKPKKVCPNCQGGARLPEARVEWLYGGEGAGGVVSVPGWTGVLDSSGAVLAWACGSCHRTYKNPNLAALEQAQRKARIWRSRTRRFLS